MQQVGGRSYQIKHSQLKNKLKDKIDDMESSRPCLKKNETQCLIFIFLEFSRIDKNSGKV